MGELEREYYQCSGRNEGKVGLTVILFQLGIFLCMRCASLHRQLGTHVSKVKSLSMDSWSNEQVEVQDASNLNRNILADRVSEHEAQWEREFESDIQSEEYEA